MAQYLHITQYSHPPICFKSFLGYLSYLIQCKCHVSSCWAHDKFKFCFWNFLGFFFPKIFLIRGWLNPSLGKPWIWRGDYMSKLQITKKKEGEDSHI